MAKTLEERRAYQREYMRKRRGYTGKGPGAHNTLGEKHPQWKGGERKFEQVLAPAYFKKVRYCERCNKDLLNAPPAMRAVHHIDHNRKNNVESNFELLCKRCHQVEHECWLNFTERATTIPKGSTPKHVEAEDTRDGDDIV